MLVVPTLILPRDEELEVLGRTVEQSLERSVQSIDVIGRGQAHRGCTFSVAMQDGNHLIARIADSHMPIGIMESEIATMKFIHERTSIPVPKILAYELDQSHPLGAHILLEKVGENPRICSIPKRRRHAHNAGLRRRPFGHHFDDLPADAQDSLVTQLAHFMLEASRLSFPAIGSILLPKSPAADPAAVPPLGPLTHPCFYVDGRNALPLDRGPFPTARAYFLACAERERAATRALFTSGAGAPAGAEYQALLADSHALVERAVTLLIELVRRCEGLDGADAELARYALDLHELGPKNVVVAPDEPTRILAVVDWQSASVRPLWRCAPCFARRSLVTRSLRVRIDTDDTRHALDEVAEYDTFRDGFLVLPTLQSILATLPGEEDVDGLRKLLDPQTLVGRAARISLLTHGPGVLSLATSTPGSPLSDSPVSFGWNRKLYRYSVPATPRYSVPPTPIA
ncbi:hypothetical protein EDB87DRAFT_1685360 [Lactarius vividus]|nr:hypothetical protein EDB87DRAFT_1685360 [Lactarius vividus]